VRFFQRQNGRYVPTRDAEMIFEQINAIYSKVDDLAEVIGKTLVFGPLPKTSTGKIQKFLPRDQTKSLEKA
jgi:hypothetical protein